jgi:tellurite resistance protein TerC
LISANYWCYLSGAMSTPAHSLWVWAAFCAFILLMLSIDLGLLNRKARAFTPRRAIVASSIWITLAIIFDVIVLWKYGKQPGLEFLTGYVIELSLSVDNLFVFVLVFSYFKVPEIYQHRVLFWGVIGALVMRVTMILFGAALIQRIGEGVLYFFGAFLVYTGVKMFLQKENAIDPDENRILRLVTRCIPFTNSYDGKRFFTRADGRRTGTLLLLVLIFVEITDLIFAVDSIPAIFAVTRDTFIIYTSNVFAIMGLRTLYFLLLAVIGKFHYLKTGLSIVLAFIGVKMLLPIVGIQIPIEISLGVVAVVLLSSVLASFRWPVEAPGLGTPESQAHPGSDKDETG